MRGSVGKLQHTVVGLVIACMVGLVWFGLIGRSYPERFDAKTIMVEATPTRDLLVVEYVDQDFGTNDRHGYERIIPHDYGEPIGIDAESPDAPDQVGVVDLGGRTRIRIGDPDETITGQHRYELTYTYPEPGLDEHGLALDIVAAEGNGWPGDQETGRFEVVVTGMELDDPRCSVGPLGAEGGCELAIDPSEPVPVYRAVVEPLPKGHGLTISGGIVGYTQPASIPAPAIPERRDINRLPLALAMIPAGLLGAIPVYHWARRRGRNEVFGRGAADAAFGPLPAPGAARPEDGMPFHLVDDDEFAEMATIEFVPPQGIAPWEASVLITEQLGGDTVPAWLSGLVGREAVTLADDDGNLSIASGPRRSELDTDDARLLDDILALDDPYVTGKYDPKFAAAWKGVRQYQQERIKSSGWWRRQPPGSSGPTDAVFLVVLVAFALFVGVIFFASWNTALGLLGSWPAALALGVAVPAVMAVFLYGRMLPARSAHGSALALRSESFRRFLEASEAKHVEWAWSQGLLREYSAWAVALGEADAWSRALEQANVPAPAQAMTTPLLVSTMSSSLHTAHTAPSDSSSGGGGGGSVGGGGGGGSSGSW